jgi:hypothetical protein
MAITDFEPIRAAIVLDYKLSDSLNEGQIQFQTICLLTRLVKNILK